MSSLTKKLATTLDEQIKLLKSRGMLFSDFTPNEIKKKLLNIGYYRLGFYWKSFEIKTEHKFKDDTEFSNVVLLYELELELRNLLLKYTTIIEIDFKTKIIYYVSNKYKNDPIWFVDPNIIDKKAIKRIKESYSKLKNNYKPIKKHHEKYSDDYAPAWKTLEFFTFGTILKIFEHLKCVSLKQKISKSYWSKN